MIHGSVTAGARRRPGDAGTRTGLISQCDHYEPEVRVGPPQDGCVDCLVIGGTWVHLRQCLACGHTSCCNQSPNRHAAAHFGETGHPMIRSVAPDVPWQWCYDDDRLYLPDDPAQEGDPRD